MTKAQAAEEIGKLSKHILDLAPTAGLKVRIRIEEAKGAGK